MATTGKPNDDLLAPEALAKYASLFRRRALDFTLRAKAPAASPADKALFTQSASTAKGLAAVFERMLAETLSERVA